MGCLEWVKASGVDSLRGRPSVPPARCAGDSALRRDPDVHASAARHRPRRGRRGRLRDPVPHRPELPHGAALRAGGDPLALVQLDSHGDTWEQYFGQKFFHGTTFKRAVEEGLLDATASVQAGMRGSLYGAEDIDVAKDLGFTVLTTDELRDLGAPEYGKLVLEKVGTRPVFVSFDIDFLDPAFAPVPGRPRSA